MTHKTNARSHLSRDAIPSNPSAINPRSTQRSFLRRTWSVVLAVSVVLVLTVGVGQGIAASHPESSPSTSQARVSNGPALDFAGASAAERQRRHIDDLIEGLGSASYATRVRCRGELSRIGLAAFDALRRARNHVDNEIAIAARRLTSSLEVHWSQPEDPTYIRDLLHEYGSKSISRRRQIVRSLQQQPASEVLSPLVRLARYEPDRHLARQAATAAISLSVPTSSRPAKSSDSVWFQAAMGNAEMSPTPNPSADVILRIVGDDDQPSSRWLRQHAADRRAGSVDVPAWSQLVATGRAQIDEDPITTNASDASRTRIDPDASEASMRPEELLALVRTCANLAHVTGQTEAASNLLRRHVDLLPSRTPELMEMITWSLDHQFFDAIVAIHPSHRITVERSPLLLYWTALAHQSLNQTETSRSLADQAFAMNPLVIEAGDSDSAAMSDRELGRRADAHLEMAGELVARGQFDWARREFELVIDQFAVDTIHSADARIQLSSMLGDLQDHAGVIETLQPLADRIDKDDRMKSILSRGRFPYPTIRSRIDFHRGQLKIQTDLAAAKLDLERAYDNDPTNIDILIQMYRLPGDDDWRDMVMNELDEAIARAEREVTAARRDIPLMPGRFARGQLADKLNNYAWLICNTEGDLQKALRFSEMSLKEEPNNPALLDTCARCHFANGQFRDAVETQAKAVDLMPHSPPLKRQLREFQMALNRQSESTEAETAAATDRDG
ncbi:MAG: tetratricopeptide repeat protein [Planctomycetota bacterium]